jgi:hypothetical protein
MDPFSGGCGVMSSSGCRPFPQNDDRCPVPDLVASGTMNAMGVIAGITASGCCTSSNQCGLDFGMGCQGTDFLCSYISKDDAASLDWKTCDGMSIPLPDGCGQNGRVNLPGIAGSGS